MEIVPLKDFPDYGITRDGKVFSLPREIYNGHSMFKSKLKEMTPNKLAKGYLQVYLKKDKKNYCKLVHRLVAETFVKNPNPEEYDQINHIDGCKQNNNVENLEWCNNSENQVHAWKTGLQKPHTNGWGTTRPTTKVAEIDAYNNVIKIYKSIADAERTICGKTCGNLVSSIKRNGTFYGHKFIYA